MAAVLCITLPAAGQSTPAAPLLTEQQAIEMAKARNRQTRRAMLDVDRAARSIWETKTSYLPQTSLRMTGGFPLADFSFTIPRGALGTYPATGPIPGTNIGITTSQGFTLSTYGVIAQPLSELYKIHLGVRLAENVRASAAESMRQQRQASVDQVQTTYHQICILESQLAEDASQQRALEETLRTIESSVAQGTALEGDRLQAKASLAQQVYSRSRDEDALITAKEQLNLLLARDLDTTFSVEALPAAVDEELDLAQARATALAQRPEMHLAKLQAERAGLQVKQEKAGYIPDINAQLTYVGFQGVSFLPKNAAVAGLSLSWNNPWDWGSRRANIAALRDASRQQALSVDDTRQQVLLDVDQKFRALRESRLLVDVAQASRQASAESLRVITNQFKQHEALLADVLRQAAADQRQAQGYTQALGSYWTARADFERALGRD